jgi:hypothetical protein
MEPASKSILKSKTGWIGMVVAVILEFHPDLNAWLVRHPSTLILGYTILIFLLRRISDGAVHFLWRKKPNDSFSHINCPR